MLTPLNIPSRKRSAPTPHHLLCRGLTRWRAILVLVSLPLATIAEAGEPASAARELQRLIPPDASVVLTVEDLRGQVRELMASRLATEFLKLPAVKTWFDSEKYEQLETARDQIEGLLQAKLTEIRDQVLGDAVVIALRLPADSPVDPGQAQGMLVLKAGNPALLKRLVDLVNKMQKQNGEIAAVVERKRGDISYFIREFPAGSEHRPEAFVTFPDGTFAISNFEGMIAELVDRKTASANAGSHSPASMADLPRFQSLDRKLPERALARLYIDARLAESLFKNSPQPKSPPESLIRRYIGALDTAGAALVFTEGHIGLNAAEVFQPGKFREVIGDMPARSASTTPSFDQLPTTTLGVASLDVDFTAIFRLIEQVVPETEHTRLASAEAVLKGLLLGQDLRTRILPCLGPRVLAFVDTPIEWQTGHKPEATANRTWPFPVVLALQLQADPLPDAFGSKAAKRPTVAEAMDNGLNTVLALVTLNGKFAEAHTRIVTHEVVGVTVKALDPPLPAAYGVDRSGNQIVLSNSPTAVERYLAHGSSPTGGARFMQLHARAFPEAHSFLCLDLAAIETMIATHRDRIIDILSSQKHRSRDEVTHDLDQFLPLSQLFDAAYLTSRIDGESATTYQTLGLLTRRNSSPEATSPKP